MKPGLERIHLMIAALGLENPAFVVVQVAGTNGKGSTSAMLERLAREHGLATGLHISPHFLSVRERVLINGAPLPETAWVALGNTLMRHGGEELSYFEFVTCLAMLAFAEAKAELAVMETGLGGTFDATSALHADLVVFTPIAFDHQAVLGNTLEAIAADKAGAIRPGKPAVSARQRPEAWKELVRVAEERNAVLMEVPAALPMPRTEEDPEERPHPAGPHQQDNARLALFAWRTLSGGGLPAPDNGPRCVFTPKTRVPLNILPATLVDARLPGRMQRSPALPYASGEYSPCALGWPPLLLDGAHNSHGLAALGLSLARGGVAPLAVVFSCLEDKDLDAMLPQLRALATGMIVTPPIADNPRAMPAEELASRIGLNAVPAAGLREAVAIAAAHMAERMPEVFDPGHAQAERHPLLICGSLYLLGEFYALRPDLLGKR